MVRGLAVATAALLGIGCGGTKEQPPPYQCPAPQAPSGTLVGAAPPVGGGIGTFAPAEMGALILGPANCRIGTTSVSVAALVLGFSSFAGLCGELQQHGFCWDKANATMASLQIANVSLVATAAVPGAGTYPITIGTPPPSASLQVTAGSYARTGASCVTLASSSTNALPAAGSVTIASVSSTSVTGSANVTFTDGSTFAGTFGAAVAAPPVDLCQLVVGCASSTCVP